MFCVFGYNRCQSEVLPMIDTIYTIDIRLIDDFVNALQPNRISLLADVRSQPYSAAFPDYHKDILEKTLKRSDMLSQLQKSSARGRKTLHTALMRVP